MPRNDQGVHLDQKIVTNHDGGGPRVETRLQHPAYRAPAGFAAMQPATHRASTVLFPDIAALRARDWRHKQGYTYGLHGTPTTFELEGRLAEIEGAAEALLCPSGLAAIALVDLALLRQGDAVLIPDNAYGPGIELAQQLLRGLGIEPRLYDPLRPETASFDARTRLLWLEAPGSVSMEMPDLRALVALARQHGATTVLDNTWSAGLALRPFDLGIDISVQALTKYQSGGADLLMGAVLTRDPALHEKLMLAHMRLGYGVGADDASLVLRGLPSLALRYAAQDAAARRVATWLARRPEVACVLHPAFPDSPGHAHWARDCSGAAGLFSFALQPEVEPARVDAFIDALRLFGIGYSWGGPRSLAVPYAMRALRGPDWRGPHTLVRLSIGLEHPDDLIADLEQALRATPARDAPALD
jgi:cystathionine beta-lyase